METLKLEKTAAKKLFPVSPKWFKEVLINTFGKDLFTGKITERIKTFEDACDEIGEDSNDRKFTTGTPDDIAYQKIKVIAKALREGWEPDWNDTNQKKWYPWFKWSAGSGFDFSASGCYYDYSYSYFGSRLCTDTSEKALYVGKQFASEYEKFMLYNK